MEEFVNKFTKEKQEEIADIDQWEIHVAKMDDKDQQKLLDSLNTTHQAYLGIMSLTKEKDTNKFAVQFKEVRSLLENINDVLNNPNENLKPMQPEELNVFIAFSTYFKLTNASLWHEALRERINEKRKCILQERNIDEAAFECLKEKEISEIVNQAIVASKQDILSLTKKQAAVATPFFIHAWAASSQEATSKLQVSHGLNSEVGEFASLVGLGVMSAAMQSDHCTII